MKCCENYTALISAAVDGELTDAERRDLMEHLAQCPDCREIYGQMMAIHQVLCEDALDAPLPGDLVGDVMAKVRAQGQVKKPRHHWWQMAAAAACCALVFLGYQHLQGGAPSSNAVDAAASYSVAANAQDAGTGSQDAYSAAPQGDGAAVESGSTADATGDVSEAAEVSEDTTAAAQETVEDVRTSFDSGDAKVSTSSMMDSGEDTPERETEEEVPCLTLRSSSPALKTWLAEHLTAEEPAADATGAQTWLITVPEYEALAAYLTEQQAPYTLESGADATEADGAPSLEEGAAVCVVYLPEERPAAP